ncbi:HD domain-containing phosphohydrolase [Desulfomonile tiedjei]|uniref:Response regulator containing a CheY-like receiver domain and an HD-GYP domain n=1 Tax=Desulfomonile tiedjei (strain ATCC 49306 / DSM 6799 / DCB-1) TaxID=706587 RepID=I4C8A0_DESTA|nr:HD domain-containing phosphohydrolase [Desulfomonile tiedjei]AFM25791.1 response regulator containing a CheY-like receiver domain and an HD-GYP domain [Desulfomonile tiedjei DSM 6799]
MNHTGAGVQKTEVSGTHQLIENKWCSLRQMEIATEPSNEKETNGEKKEIKVLLVDDEPFICDLLSRWLTSEGYLCTTSLSGESALELLAKETYHLVLSDIRMPGMSGLDLLKIVTKSFPDAAVIVVTAVDEQKTAIKTLKSGAYGYIVKPFDKSEILVNIANALERRRVTLLMREYECNLEWSVQERTAQVRAREEQIILRLLSASEYRDDETGAHIRRIGMYSSVIAQALGWDSQTVDDIRLAAPMHDVGKIGIPDRILQKPGQLTPEEFEIMKKHTEIGGCILDNSDIPVLRMAQEIALSHHEKWDGTGYPRGLAGEAIPQSGRIVAVVDVYDALIHKRVYKPALPEEEVLSILSDGRGKHFDPIILDHFMNLLPEMRRIRTQIREE